MMKDKYKNRQEAGRVLASLLQHYADRKNLHIFALPRGGVPVAYEIAKALHAELDVFIVRKLGVPGHSELAMGAIAMGGESVFNQDIIDQLNIPASAIEAIIAKEKEELVRREMAYRGNHAMPIIKNKTIILVDDGIATGATMRAAILALRQMGAATIVAAVPVADRDICETFKQLVDDFICPLQPSPLYAVGAWYEDFSQTEDDEVYHLLKASKKLASIE